MNHTFLFVRFISFLFVVAILLTFSLAIVSMGAPESEIQIISPKNDGFFVSFSNFDAAMKTIQKEQICISPVEDSIYWIHSEQELRVLKRAGVLAFSEPNYIVDLFDVEETKNEAESFLKNGWAYDTLSAAYPEAVGLNGEGVRIAVIDSGVDVGNIDLLSAHIEEGYDYLEQSSEMIDPLYHGTRVIQIICADQNEIGLTGIARGAAIVPLRCFSEQQGGSVLLLSQAIRDAVDVYHCDIINMSWGVTEKSEVLEEAIRYAYDKGTMLVASSGNVNRYYPQGTVFYPAAYSEVIGVAAIDENQGVCEVSQQNESVLLCAPGDNLSFTGNSGNSMVGRGTSFAAPCVSAELAVLLQLWSDATYEELLGLIMERAVDLGEPGYDVSFGFGLLPLDRLIGTHGSSIGYVQKEDGMAVRIFSWMIHPEGGRLFTAFYDADDQITEIRMKEGNDRITVSREFPDRQMDNGGMACVFYTDRNFMPVEQQEVLRLQ